MAILWHEMWHEALEEASRQYFGESNVEGMLNTLLPLHKMMQDQEPATLKEISFAQVAPCPPTNSPKNLMPCLLWGKLFFLEGSVSVRSL